MKRVNSVCKLYVGTPSHADDIHTLSANISDTRDQITSVSNFSTSRGLVLSTEKCRAIISPSTPSSLPAIQADDISIPITNSRCLSAWWMDPTYILLEMDQESKRCLLCSWQRCVSRHSEPSFMHLEVLWKAVYFLFSSTVQNLGSCNTTLVVQAERILRLPSLHPTTLHEWPLLTFYRWVVILACIDALPEGR